MGAPGLPDPLAVEPESELDVQATAISAIAATAETTSFLL